MQTQLLGVVGEPGDMLATRARAGSACSKKNLASEPRWALSTRAAMLSRPGRARSFDPPADGRLWVLAASRSGGPPNELLEVDPSRRRVAFRLTDNRGGGHERFRLGLGHHDDGPTRSLANRGRRKIGAKDVPGIVGASATRAATVTLWPIQPRSRPRSGGRTPLLPGASTLVGGRSFAQWRYAGPKMRSAALEQPIR